MSCSEVCMDQLKAFENVTVICAQVSAPAPSTKPHHLSINHSRNTCLTVAPKVGHWESFFYMPTIHSEMLLP